VGIVFLDTAGMVVENNPALETMLGCGNSELRGRQFSSYSLPEYRDAQTTLFQEMLDGRRGSCRMTTRCTRKDGSVLWGLLSASPIRDQRQAIQYIVAMVEDITERKRAEEAVIRSRDFYRLLLNELPNPIRLADSDGMCDYFNRAWLAFTGRKLEHELGDGWVQGIHAEDRERVTNALRDAVQGRIPFTTEYRLRRSTGEVRWIMEFGAPFTDVGGNLAGYLSSCYDVHDRKALEETLQSISITDELTGLLNRRGFFALAQQQMKIASRTKRGLLLFYGDLDGLKSINDTLGHRVGDQALVEASALLREVFRESDIIARLGGDEFAVLMMEDTGPLDDVAVLDRLGRAVNLRNAQVARTYQLSLSAGIKRYDPEDPISLDRLISIADGLMYEEKKAKKRL
jgi:diguanylate cyclase (GGDEF)-like protein/PAS domain S-box-containing protein